MSIMFKKWLIFNLCVMGVTVIFAIVEGGDIVFRFVFVFLLSNTVWMLFPKIR